jgi:hypothetical protein
MSTPYVAALTRTALAEHAAYKSHVETDPILAARIREYWEDIGKEFPGVETPWSGVFVSWCVLTSGATQEEFAASARHGDYVKWAIQNAKAGKGLFRGLPFEAEPPAPGDLIQWNRSNNTYDFAHAAQHASYPSHVAIVVSLVRDAMGMHALTGGPAFVGRQLRAPGLSLARLSSRHPCRSGGGHRAARRAQRRIARPSGRQ